MRKRHDRLKVTTGKPLQTATTKEALADPSVPTPPTFPGCSLHHKLLRYPVFRYYRYFSYTMPSSIFLKITNITFHRPDALCLDARSTLLLQSIFFMMTWLRYCYFTITAHMETCYSMSHIVCSYVTITAHMETCYGMSHIGCSYVTTSFDCDVCCEADLTFLYVLNVLKDYVLV